MIQLFERLESIEIGEIQIAPPHQGRGIGSQILRDIVKRAHEGGKKVVLATGLKNDRASALYERLGFQRVGQTETHSLFEFPGVPSA
jgi:ribosomal protein S18 acetylase RimI-like enzyme